MSIDSNHFAHRNAGRPAAPRRNEGGSATVVFMALLAIMVILVTVNGKALFRLHREVRFIEQQQIKRLNASQTNVLANPKPDSK